MLGRLVVVASLAISVVDVYLLGDRRFVFPWVEVLGFALFVAGISLDIVGRVTLGRFYSETARMRPDHKLITRGIYRYIRHPVYLGVVLFAFSAPLIIGSLFGLVIMMALIPMLVHRIRLEERVMAERFGQEYTEYARRTKRFIPGIF